MIENNIFSVDKTTKELMESLNEILADEVSESINKYLKNVDSKLEDLTDTTQDLIQKKIGPISKNLLEQSSNIDSQFNSLREQVEEKIESSFQETSVKIHDIAINTMTLLKTNFESLSIAVTNDFTEKEKSLVSLQIKVEESFNTAFTEIHSKIDNLTSITEQTLKGFIKECSSNEKILTDIKNQFEDKLTTTEKYFEEHIEKLLNENNILKQKQETLLISLDTLNKKIDYMQLPLHKKLFNKKNKSKEV